MMSKKLYMVIETFKNGDAEPVYRRFREQGRLAPAGLSYVSSWVHDTLDRCYQLMETDDPSLLDQWMLHWSDLVDFEVHPVMTSSDAAQRVGSSLRQVDGTP
jgi:Protein of unknown function (DUF3303)